MSAYDDMPLGTALRNPTTGTTFIKTHHLPLPWLMAPRGRVARRVTSAALDAASDLVEMKEATP